MTREFYINDRGNQMNLFGASIEAAALGKPSPRDGYHGGYIADLAARVVSGLRNHSTSELLRTLLRVAASKPTSWLSVRSHIVYHLVLN